MNAQTTIALNADEQFLLLYLLHAETVATVHAVVTAAQLNPVQKTGNIINQMDFCFQLRTDLRNVKPEPLGDLQIGEAQREVLKRLVEGAQENIMTADQVLMLRQYRRDLLLKLGDSAGFLTSADAAVPGGLKFN